MGSTRLETAVQIVVPAAFSGIMAAFIVGISRAICETMVVALSVGAGPHLTFNPFRGAETTTGHIHLLRPLPPLRHEPPKRNLAISGEGLG